MPVGRSIARTAHFSPYAASVPTTVPGFHAGSARTGYCLSLGKGESWYSPSPGFDKLKDARIRPREVCAVPGQPKGTPQEGCSVKVHPEVPAQRPVTRDEIAGCRRGRIRGNAQAPDFSAGGSDTDLIARVRRKCCAH